MHTVKEPARRSFGVDAVELLLVSIALVFATWVITSELNRRERVSMSFFAAEAQRELAAVAEAYGSSRHSRHAEEWLIRDFFKDERNGVFLDVGANHYRDENNTYFLETSLDWSGIAVEPQQEFGADYVVHRPRTRFLAYFVSDTSGAQEQLFVHPANTLVASSDLEFTRREGYEGTARPVETITLNDLLAREGIAALDFVSMDIELAEPKALAGFDIRRYRPRLVCIEGHAEVRQQILDYFARHEYVLIGKYLRADPKNLYFTPLAFR